MTEEQLNQADREGTGENIWMVALYEQETSAEELLERLRAIGIDTTEASTVRVEINDEMRRSSVSVVQEDAAFSLAKRAVVTGALAVGTMGLFIGMIAYTTGLFVVSFATGIFHQAVTFLLAGMVLGALLGMVFGQAKERRIVKETKQPDISQINSDGYLVAVKMNPPMAEQAEEIARGLGAKEILL